MNRALDHALAGMWPTLAAMTPALALLLASSALLIEAAPTLAGIILATVLGLFSMVVTLLYLDHRWRLGLLLNLLRAFPQAGLILRRFPSLKVSADD
jgi:hypothetical protein